VIALVFLELHCFLKPFLHNQLNGSRQISHLLVAPQFGGRLCTTGLMCRRSHGIAIPVVPATLLGVMSQVGPALCLAMLAELTGLGLLWDLFTGASRGGTLLGTSLGNCRSGVLSRLEMYHTNVLMYHTMVLLAHPTKVRC
jgi:hypothetical protein